MVKITSLLTLLLEDGGHQARLKDTSGQLPYIGCAAVNIEKADVMSIAQPQGQQKRKRHHVIDYGQEFSPRRGIGVHGRLHNQRRNMLHEDVSDRSTSQKYALPVKSLTGYLLTKYGESKSFPLNKMVIDSLAVSPGNKILEIGYGRGQGLQYCLSKLIGDGLLCGIERSQYMEDVATKRFILELTEGNTLRFDKCIDLRNLPYPTDLFNSIYHVDVTYFIHQERLPEICKELYRVLLPGGKIVCGMDFIRLKKLSKYGILDESQWDPMRYMSCLEPVGFVDVKIDYVDHSSGRQFQLISARKPEADEAYFDPLAQMAHLEKQVKREMLLVELRKSGRIPTKEDLDIMRDDIEK